MNFPFAFLGGACLAMAMKGVGHGWSRRWIDGAHYAHICLVKHQDRDDSFNLQHGMPGYGTLSVPL
ncbi:hypothetical protein B0H67DRAFT_582074 [Lasiosphaeris hirsuta]|uniref:Uncharacterized protein n=1 Tax=Lasiosphaeris hirsuta TaxID=260670 RepID=A0AA40DTQ5_9PEZI|nr:hypothetical protein B0H67DRAFT_582074 [Lasiosphaeris hirsuta]